MPDIEPNDDVKQYLEKKGMNADDLGENTIAALNSLSPEELNALDKVDLALEQDGHAASASPRAVH